MNWDDLRLLLAVSRRGSFLQAGDLLGIAASTLSRRITAMEAAIGEPLVERGADGTRLTSRGLGLVAAAAQLEAALSAGVSQAEGLSGRIRISAGEGFTGPVNAAIAAFTGLHPGCQVDFIVTPGLLKLSRSEADLAIRTVHLGEPSLIYQRLNPVAFGVFAAPDLPVPLRPDEAGMIDLLPPLDQLAHLRAAREAGFSKVLFRVSSFSAQLAAVIAGHGMAVLPRKLATGLAEPFGGIALPPLEVWLVSRPEALRQPHIRAFADMLRRNMHDQRGR